MRTSIVLPLLFVLVACGGETPPANAPASPSATSTATAPGAAPSGGTATLTPTGSAGSTKAARRTSATWRDCHAAFRPAQGDDFAKDAEKMGQACAATTGMHPVGAAFKGTQQATNPPQAFKFSAQAGHCYRAYAAASPGIGDLDLMIKDSTGAVAGEDSTDDPTPVVLEDGAVCFDANDDASVIIAVGAGGGDYGVQIWSD